jgi:hypothetical protein
MAGLKNRPMDGGVNSQRKIVQASPRGIPSKRAPNVTQKELTIIGKMPKDPWLGTHRFPRMKARGPTFQIKGSPSSKMKNVMRAKIVIEERAITRRVFSMSFSFISIANSGPLLAGC